MIEFEKVIKRFDSFTAVDSISFTVPEGEVTVLIGPSGCGKTTSLRLINRMIEPTDGYIRVQGRPVKSFRPEELRRGIGYVIQSVGLLPHMSVRDNIGIVPRLLRWEKERRHRRADELLQMIGLDPETYGDKYPHQLSGGEAQRIGVARALAANPPILLMDEPFGAVDPLNREVLQKEFLKLQRQLKKTVIFVTHDLDEAIRLGDQIILMQAGTIVQHDTPERILAEPANQFVRDFVGTDRALKRLSCFPVEDYLQDAMTVPESELKQARRSGKLVSGSGIVWVTDHDGVLQAMQRVTGNPEGEPLSEPLNRIVPAEVGINTYSTLRDALSRILGQGLPAVPVIDDSDHVLGEIRLADIEEVNQSELTR